MEKGHSLVARPQSGPGPHVCHPDLKTIRGRYHRVSGPKQLGSDPLKHDLSPL
jgi:hypothetical protein